ncbi:LysM peptidoglycan-binding domain-containing protein [Jeotgalibacillus marinus]|uniref:LysM peptidoglycan-binding domain-containing protein n=1 Tax=Jeotgalibacillus marinus TaxID=86667 RepID=A0ABV3PYR9_9BACL
MKRDPYRDQANKSRQEINAKKEVEDTPELKSGELSRSVLHEKKRNVKAAQKKQFPLRKVLLAVFILLPLTVVALSFFFLNDDEKDFDRGQSVGVEQNDRSGGAGASDDQIENDDSPEKEQPVTNEESEEEAVEEPIEDAPVEEPEPEPEAPAPVEETPPAEETTAVEEPQDSIRKHTVQAGENLYRIAINQVGSADGMEQIKQLNGLSDDEIYEGQVLEIPVP